VNRSVVLRTLAKGTELYHSTKISDELVTAILKGAETLKSPAFFKDTPTNSYGPKLISFKVATNINVLDFCNPQTADALYHKLEAAELYDARDALQLKAHANIKNDVLVSMNKGIFKTKGSWDENLISGIRKLGYDGWIMPFSGFKEIMLLDASPVTAESAM
jgi:hypothetical protein